jgi:hypothetical protein
MIMIEGIRVKPRVVSRKQLFSIWKTVTNHPFPRVKAFQLEDKEFNNVIKKRQCGEDDIREVEEWGRILSAQGIDACVFNGDEFPDVDYVILIRKNPYHTMAEILKHELSHIANGDL